MARQGSLKVGGAADTIREVGLAAVCEHALEMEMSDGGFQEQSCPGTGRSRAALGPAGER